MENKRGQGLSTNAIILIILGVVVLIILILGFTMGWEKINPFISTSNVETIKTSCGVACATNNIFDFCSQERTLKTEGVELTGTCSVLNDTAYPQYGIDTCSSITCPDLD
ncbi:MAG TPA: hypothetical protein ENI22_00335 [Candidatus Pacearchaeota archaeon]|nr:hypothetical protein [Candidatus Pacearchaeota archaeon]